MNLNHSASEIIAEYLRHAGTLARPQKGASWPLYVGHLPSGKASTSDAAMIQEIEGKSDGYILGTGELVSHPCVQLIVRGRDYEVTRRKTAVVCNAIHAIENDTVVMEDGTRYTLLNVAQVDTILPIGVDPDTSSRLYLFSADFISTIREED